MIQIPTTYASGQVISKTPAVYLFENFVAPEEAAAIINIASSRMKRALVSSESEGEISDGRTGYNCWLPHDHSPETLQLAQRISKLVGIHLSMAESFQVIHYGKTQKYAAHYDGWDPETGRGKRCMERGGQRLVTCLIYLNDVAKGGGTEFPKLGLEVEAVAGRMVVFHNCLEGTTTCHPDSLHGGLPVEDGEKWAVNLWFRERPLQS